MIRVLGEGAAGGFGDPTSYSPLAIVALVVMFLLWRMKNSDAADQQRINDCEARLAAKDAVIQAKEDELTEQRSLKHAALNREARAQGTLDVIERLVPACTCGALDPVAPLLDVHRRRRDRP